MGINSSTTVSKGQVFAFDLPGDRRRLLYGSRILSMVATVVYVAIFSYVYEVYITVNHGISAGMYFRDFNAYEYTFVYVVCGLIGYCMPTSIDRASSLFIWFLSVFYVLPAIVLTFHIGSRDLEFYYVANICLVLAMCWMAFITQYHGGISVPGGEIFGPKFAVYLLICWLIFTAILFFVFGSIMSFSGVDDIYQQRALSKQVDSGFIVDYIRTYYSYVINPMLIGLGLSQRRWSFVFVGVFGSLVTYLIDAQKIALLLVFAMFGLFYALKRGFVGTWIFTLVIALACLGVFLVARLSPLAAYIADVLLLRAIAIPGATFVQYYDVFSFNGYTYWSSVRGLNFIVSPPAIYAQDPDWPELGVIIGRAYFPWVEGLNNSASGFSGEGVAAAGAFGVLVIGFLIGVYLRLVDEASRRWHKPFVLVALVPMAMAMANAHLSTVLVSFGGGLWLVLFYIYRQKDDRYLV